MHVLLTLLLFASTPPPIRTVVQLRGAVNEPVFSPSGRFLLARGEAYDDPARVFDVALGREIAAAERNDVPWGFPDDDTALVVRGGKLVRWRFASGAFEAVPGAAPINRPHLARLHSGWQERLTIDVSGDGKGQLAFVSSDGGRRDIATGLTYLTTASTAFSGDGKLAVASSRALCTPDGCTPGFVLIDVERAAVTRLVSDPGLSRFSAAMSANGERILVGGRLYDRDSGRLIRDLSRPTRKTTSAYFSKDGSALHLAIAVAEGDQDADARRVLFRTFDLATLRARREVQDSNAWPGPVALNRTRTFASMRSEAYPARVIGLDLDTLSTSRSLQRPEAQALSFSDDGALAAYGGTIRAKSWFVRVIDAKGKQLEERKGKTPLGDYSTGVVISPSGRLVAHLEPSSGPRNMRPLVLWEWKTSRVRTVSGVEGPECDSKPHAAFFSDDEATLFVTCKDSVAEIDVATASQRKRHAARVVGHRLLPLEGERAKDPFWTGFVTDVSPDGRLVAAVVNESVQLHDAAGRLLATIVAVGERDYVTFTPEGYYSGTPRAMSALHFARGTEVFPFDSFDLVLNRPDKVAAAIGVANPRRVALLERLFDKRARRLGLDPRELTFDLHRPTLASLAPPPLVADAPTVRLDVRATDDKHPITRLFVFVNGVPLHGRDGYAVAPALQVERRFEVELSSGENRIELAAMNAKGEESLRVSHFTFARGPARARAAHVFAIGVSKYAAPEDDLEYAAKDARDIAALFGALERRGFARVNVHTLFDGEVTRERVRALKAELAGAAVDDLVVLFAAGHGVRDDALDYYFATSNMDWRDPAAGGIPLAVFEDLLDDIAPRQRLMLLDTCFSGEVDETEPAPPRAQAVAEGKLRVKPPGARGLARQNAPLGDSLTLINELFSDLRRSAGVAVMASASGSEVALESPTWKNGVFTYSVRLALEKLAADRDKSKAVEMTELSDFVADRVRALTNGLQNPVTRAGRADFDFVVY